MPNKEQKIRNKEAYIRVRNILAKNSTILGKTTLTIFIALGLLSLASPAALPAGITALGIGAIGIFLDQVTQDNLSEQEILEGVQKILDNNGLLQQKDFIDYMAPFYPKLLHINETLDSFATKEELIKEINPLLPKLNEISKKIDLLVTKEDLKNAVTELKKDNPEQTENDKLKAAQDKLNEMPLDYIPEPAPMPVGSKPPKFARNELFVGRENELKQIAAWLKGNNSVAIGPVAAFSGMGGIGKTQLAAEFAHRYGQFFLGGVYWLDFSNPVGIQTEIAACSGLDENIPLEQRVNKVLTDWISPLPRLIVFDNCEDKKLVVQWRPSTGCCRVIITSREGVWGPELGIKHLPLETLTRPQSLKLLHHFREDLSLYDPDLDAIAEELGDLPLALHMAGSYLDTYRHEISPAQYLAEIRSVNPLQHESMQKGDFSPTGHDLNVGKTFGISVSRLGEGDNDQLALKIMDRAACFAPGVWIPREVLKTSLAEEIEGKIFTKGLNLLIGLGLVEENESGDVWMHRLVAGFIQTTRKTTQCWVDVEKAVINAANRANNSGYPARMAPILSHLSYLLAKFSSQENEDSASLANDMGYYLQSIADYSNARPYYEQALAIRRKALGEEHPDTALSLNNLGSLLRAMGDLAGARPYFEQALAINKKALGEEHPDTASSLNNLGYLLQAMGDLAGARPYYEQALTIRRKALGEDHPDTALSLNNMGYLLQAMGDLAGARSYFEQALAINKKALGEEHPDTALSLNNLGYLIKAMGDLAGARPYYEQALAINKKVLGEEHPGTARSLNNLGGLLQAMGDLAGARPYYEQALTINKKTLGEEHTDTAWSLNNLGGLLDSMGDLAGARPYYEQALAINKKALGEEHPDTALSLNNLGGLMYSMGDLAGARPYFEQALTIRRKALGEDHPDTARSLNNLGSLLRAMGDLAGARPYYEQALAIRRKVLGEDHPDTALSLNNMGYLLQAMGDMAGARPYFEQALAIFEKKLGPDHPTTKIVRRNLESITKSIKIKK